MRRSQRRRLNVALLVTISAVVAVGTGRPHTSAMEPTSARASSGCIGSALTGCLPPSPAPQPNTAEEQLAVKYAPIVLLREPDAPCEPEAFRPSPVEIALGNPRVLLWLPDQAAAQPTAAPGAVDLYRHRADRRAYLDLPGNPGTARCTYMSDFQALGADTPAVTYAHIQREKGYLALQYWFYYYFNDWNNQHEGDWEMIQLLFRAGSAEEALTQEPVRVSYAQHGGGETAGWNDPKLTRDGGHPIVFVSGGSHASYFEPKVYLGLGEGGAGLGCDDASAPARRVQLEPRVVPATITDPNDPFAWSAFQGRWGERRPGLNNGPLGPNSTKRWTQPVTHFDENIPDYNVTLPQGPTVGPNAVEVLCDIVSLSGVVLGLFYESPVAVGLAGGAAALFLGTFFAWTVRRDLFAALAGTPDATAAEAPARTSITSRSAVSLYLHHAPVFLAIGLAFFPIGVAGAVLIGDGEISMGDVVIGIPLIGGLPLLSAFVFVNSAVAAVLGQIGSGRRPALPDAYRAIWSRFGALLWGRVKALGIVSLLLVSVVGIPFAVNRLIRWLFVEQAIMLDGADSRTALAVSGRAVKGRWWRTCSLAVVLNVTAFLAGPIVAISALLLLHTSVDVANAISSVVYALVLPLIFIAMSQFYEDLKARRAAHGE